MGNFKIGTHFVYKEQEFCIIGDDVSQNQIECQTVPFDNNYYWFKVLGNNKVSLLV